MRAHVSGSMNAPGWAWTLLGVVVLAAVAIDLGAHRGGRRSSTGSAIAWSAVWVALGLAFGGFVWGTFGKTAGQEYLAAFLVEKSLSADNLCVFLAIFAELGVPAPEQRRTLFWGIGGAIATRGLFIFAGLRLLRTFHWVIYVLGAGLLVLSVTTLRAQEQTDEPRVLAWLRRRLPVSASQAPGRFFQHDGVRWVLTPSACALLAIEISDVLFAIDSIPSAFAVTEQPFLLYSSNLFAVLGLRALYAAIAQAIGRAVLLRFGVAAVLAFAGAKIVASPWVRFGPAASLAVIASLLVLVAIAEPFARRMRRPEPR